MGNREEEEGEETRGEGSMKKKNVWLRKKILEKKAREEQNNSTGNKWSKKF